MKTEKMDAETTGKPTRGGGAKLVYETLRKEILELHLPPGMPLDETNLSERFGMSRSPIREALVRLSADGLVQMLSNRSTLVTPIDLTELPRYVEALDFIQRTTTRLAARNRTEEDLEELTRLAEAYDATCLEGRPRLMSRANKDFHMAIAEAGRNRYLSESYEKLLDEGRRILHMHYAQQTTKQDKYPLGREHFDIIDAIRRQDERAADQLAHAHTRLFHDRLVEFMRVNYIENFDAEGDGPVPMKTSDLV